MTIKTIQTNSENLILIEKSKFYGFSFLINSEDEAKEILSNLSKKYYDSTHICYAYVVGAKQKCSDNGEPQGTAGKPILDCIKKKKLDNVLVVVVRYFGGIKLGAGGLARAYSNSASAVLDMSGTKESAKCDKLAFVIKPDEIKKVELVKKYPIVKDEKTTFGQDIVVQIVCEKDSKDELIQNINNILCRKIEILSCEEVFF